MNIYVVVGSTGEYSDHDEWPVVWYDSQEAANAAAEAYTVAYRTLFGIPEGADPRSQSTSWKLREKLTKQMQQVDPGFGVDYTGTYYQVQEVPAGPNPADIAKLMTNVPA